LEFVA